MNAPTNKPNALTENLWGAVDVMLGRKDGLKRIDTSGDGIWWSFSGLLITGLVDASALSARYATHSVSQLAEPPTKLVFVSGSLLVGLTAYFLSMVLVYFMCRLPEEQARFPLTIAVHNWASPIVSVAVLPLLLLSSSGSSADGANNGLWSLVSIVTLGVFITIGIRLLRISLDVPFAKGIMFFAVSTLASLVAVSWLETLIGFR